MVSPLRPLLGRIPPQIEAGVQGPAAPQLRLHKARGSKPPRQDKGLVPPCRLWPHQQKAGGRGSMGRGTCSPERAGGLSRGTISSRGLHSRESLYNQPPTPPHPRGGCISGPEELGILLPCTVGLSQRKDLGASPIRSCREGLRGGQAGRGLGESPPRWYLRNVSYLQSSREGGWRWCSGHL